MYKCIMWSRVIGFAISVSTFSWIRLAGVLKFSLIQQNAIEGCINTLISDYLNISPLTEKARGSILH